MSGILRFTSRSRFERTEGALFLDLSPMVRGPCIPDESSTSIGLIATQVGFFISEQKQLCKEKINNSPFNMKIPDLQTSFLIFFHLSGIRKGIILLRSRSLRNNACIRKTNRYIGFRSSLFPLFIIDLSNQIYFQFTNSIIFLFKNYLKV